MAENFTDLAADYVEAYRSIAPMRKALYTALREVQTRLREFVRANRYYTQFEYWDFAEAGYFRIEDADLTTGIEVSYSLGEGGDDEIVLPFEMLNDLDTYLTGVKSVLDAAKAAETARFRELKRAKLLAELAALDETEPAAK